MARPAPRAVPRNASRRRSTVLQLGIGFLMQGAWDWVHHDDHGPTHVRMWWPPFCVAADVVIGLPLWSVGRCKRGDDPPPSRR